MIFMYELQRYERGRHKSGTQLLFSQDEIGTHISLVRSLVTATKWNNEENIGFVNPFECIWTRKDLSHTISFTILFSRIRSGADIDGLWTRMRIYRTTDSNRKRGRLGPETKIVESTLC